MDLLDMKIAHDNHLTAAHILSTRITFYAEEFEAIKNQIEWHRKTANDLRAKIEEIEARKKTEDENDNQSEISSPGK